MSRNQNQSDDVSDTSIGETRSSYNCPACNASMVHELDAIPSPICSECGFVVETDTEVPSPTDQQNDGEIDESVSWREYSSVSNSTEKQVMTALEHLEELGDELHLEYEARIQAVEVYTAAVFEKITDGRPTLLVVAAAICIGTREIEVTRPSERVAQAANLDPTKVKRCIRTFQEELDRGFTGVSAATYVPYLCEDAGLSDDVKKRARRIIDDFEEKTNNTGNHPAGIAGAAIYIASDKAVTQRGIATTAGVTKETIRNRLTELREVVNE